ncbi:MAG: hypothetical protein KBE65_20985 [Phycisphaerae bacterium]|nr:hypothetical protein [Phycisphaerae bacterium]
MVRTIRPVVVAVGVGICLLLAVSGCQREGATAPAVNVEPSEAREASPEPNDAGLPVHLVLMREPGDVVTYKVTTEVQKSVEWIGPQESRPAGYADGRSGNHVEITFEQRVKEVRANGNAVLEITIQALKYVGQIQSNVVFEFDSSDSQDQDNGLAALVGARYSVEMSPRGEVIALLDMESIRQAVKTGPPAQDVAARLFSEEVVRDRHEVPPLMALKDGTARPGQSWSNLKSFAFGAMGVKSFERVYTLQPFKEGDGRVARVAMKAIPSAAMAEELHKRRAASLPPGLFDNAEDYQGRLDLDLDRGRIREYGEEMWTEWVVVDPGAAQGVAQPAALKMGARQLHRLERVASP